MNRLILRSIPAVLALISGCLLTTPASAQDADRTLLSTFCDAANIKGSACTKARGYPNGGDRGCDVKLTANRYSGRFIAAGNPLLVVNYQSGCEAHATDNGGAVVFEQSGGKVVFRGFAPGAQVIDCLVVKNARQDWLVCLTGHMGQGILEGGVAQMALTQDYSKDISISADFLLTTEDSNGAYGANVVTCKEAFEIFRGVRHQARAAAADGDASRQATPTRRRSGKPAARDFPGRRKLMARSRRAMPTCPAATKSAAASSSISSRAR